VVNQGDFLLQIAVLRVTVAQRRSEFHVLLR